ncbi:hypothetical protein AL541_16645 [Vibrio alginolyticus]|nr:hypothetical protein AL541_16645 [Vibrio alginolyticus]
MFMAQCFKFGWRRCSPLNWALCSRRCTWIILENFGLKNLSKQNSPGINSKLITTTIFCRRTLIRILITLRNFLTNYLMMVT